MFPFENPNRPTLEMPFSFPLVEVVKETIIVLILLMLNIIKRKYKNQVEMEG